MLSQPGASKNIRTRFFYRARAWVLTACRTSRMFVWAVKYFFFKHSFLGISFIYFVFCCYEWQQEEGKKKKKSRRHVRKIHYDIYLLRWLTNEGQGSGELETFWIILSVREISLGGRSLVSANGKLRHLKGSFEFLDVRGAMCRRFLSFFETQFAYIWLVMECICLEVYRILIWRGST